MQSDPVNPSGDEPAAAPSAWARRASYVLVVGLLGFVAAGFYARWAVWSWAKEPFGRDGTVAVAFPAGMSLAQMCDRLQADGAVSNARAFRAYVFLVGKQARLQAGEYQIHLPISPQKLADQLQRGSFQKKVTIPEGWTARQIAGALLKAGVIAREGEWIEAAARPVPAGAFGEGVEVGAEGFCFPDTYHADPGSGAERFREKALKRFAAEWKSLEPERRDARSAGMSAFEVVTLASIIEREARRPEELPMMASVFLNRLAKKMKLQSCATVYYATGKPPAEPLTAADLDSASPFNTYRAAGLPAGPIGNPGRRAIEAVLRPAESDLLFFVHRGDGTHEFTKTYREHMKAVKRFIRHDPNATLQKDGE